MRVKNLDFNSESKLTRELNKAHIKYTILHSFRPEESIGRNNSEVVILGKFGRLYSINNQSVLTSTNSPRDNLIKIAKYVKESDSVIDSLIDLSRLCSSPEQLDAIANMIKRLNKFSFSFKYFLKSQTEKTSRGTKS